MRVTLVGILVALLAIITQAVEYTVSTFVDALQQGGSAASLFPHLETAGQTVVFYLYASRAVTFLLAVPIVALIGYIAGNQLDVTQDYPTVVGTFALGGGVGYLFGLGGIGLIGGGSVLAGVQSLFGYTIVLGIAAATALQYALLGLAGAAIAEFRYNPVSHENDRNAPNAEVEAHSD